MTLRVTWVYPELLSIYADRGNVLVLERRAAWRGLDLVVEPLRLGDDVDPARADLILLGGGQDRDQLLVAGELVRQAPRLREALDDGAAVLAVCGGYQLLGHVYRGHLGRDMPGTGLVDLETVAGPDRIIGNVLVDAELDGEVRRVVGFENHAGRTTLGPGVEPLGLVVAGGGNNGTDGLEGCRSGRVIGTYVHGPLLPKNPRIADLLLGWALERHGRSAPLEPLDDGLERLAAERASGIARAERR